jgi:hypothetical protein
MQLVRELEKKGEQQSYADRRAAAMLHMHCSLESELQMAMEEVQQMETDLRHLVRVTGFLIQQNSELVTKFQDAQGCLDQTQQAERLFAEERGYLETELERQKQRVAA